MSRVRIVSCACCAVLVCACAACSTSPWTSVEGVTTNTLEAAWYDGEATTWVGGRVGTLLRYDGEWTPVDTGGLESVRAIHGSAPDNVWAACDDGLLLHYAGASWTREAGPSDDDLEGLWVFSPTDLVVLQATKAFRGHPGAWTQLPTDGTYDLIWANSPSDIWLIQSLGDFARFDGSTWSEVSTGLPGVPLWYGVWGDGNDLWVVGSNLGNDSDWILHWNGSRWLSEAADWVGDVGPSYAIAGDDREIWRVGSFGFTARYTGEAWQTIAPADDLDQLMAVAVMPDTVLAVGERGVIWQLER
jgi:hypothetical protein